MQILNAGNLIILLFPLQFSAPNQTVGNGYQHGNEIIDPAGYGYGIGQKINREYYVDKCNQGTYSDVHLVFGGLLHGSLLIFIQYNQCSYYTGYPAA